MISGIYCIENKVNGKRYVGQSVDITKRRRAHLSSLKRGDHPNNYLQNSFDKYGEDNFKFYILLACDTIDLDKLEITYIKKFNSIDISKGYNLREGGNGTAVSDVTKEKMSKSAHGRFSSKEDMTRYFSDINRTISYEDVANIKEMLYNDHSVNDIGRLTDVSLNKINHIYNLQSFKHVTPEYNEYLSIRGEVHRKRLIRKLLLMYRDGRTFQSIADDSNMNLRTAIRIIQDNKTEFDEVMRERCLSYKDNKRNRMILMMYSRGVSMPKIASKLSMSRGTISKMVNHYK